jgi:hypothetical protein
MGVTSTGGKPATCKPIGGTTMNTVTEMEVVEAVEVEAEALSVAELDIIGGGQMGCALV